MIQAVIFDLDDTLHNFAPSEKEACKIMCSMVAVRYGLNSATVQMTYQQVNRAHIACWEQEGRFTSHTMQAFREEVWAETLNSLGLNLDLIEVTTLSSKYEQERQCRLALYPDALDCLNKLKDRYPLGLISNGFVDTQRKQVELLGIDKFFRVMAFEGEIGFGKPDKRVFDLVCRELNILPKDALMVGDSLVKDIKGAKDAGCLTAWLNRGAKPTSNNIIPDYTITSLDLLLQIL